MVSKERDAIKPVILAVDDESPMLEAFRALLEDDYRVITAATGKAALDAVSAEPVDLVILDILLPDIDGIEVLRRIKAAGDTEVIMVSGVKTVRTAIQAVKLGAYDYITKPFDNDDLLATVGKALERRQLDREIIYLKSEIEPFMFENMVGKSEALRQVFNLISEVKNTQCTVLITGESGTGKELIARAVHFGGLRSDRPFVAVDCAAIPESLVESELFGHERGSFTDATSRKLGKFELASGGTLFLDEIGNLHTDIQAKILRALEEREVQRVGGEKAVKIDVRVIAATNIDLKKAVREDHFRKDLYYRLNVIPVYVPPLRERKEDIPLLVDHFIRIYNRKFNKRVKGISGDSLRMAMNYNWPGNVRELRNVVERLVALSREDIISHNRLPLDILFSSEERPDSFYDQVTLRQARAEFEKQLILRVMEKARWNQTKAAQLLGIHRNALIKKINGFNLRPYIAKGRKPGTGGDTESGNPGETENSGR